MAVDKVQGLDGSSFIPKELSKTEAKQSSIERLRPKSLLHDKVLSYLNTRLDASERKMSKFYPRWNANEKRIQAWIDLPNWEQQLKEANQQGKPPKVVQIVVPYAFATINTITTYLTEVLGGRNPIFQLNAAKSEAVTAAKNMEIVLQYQADHTRFLRHLHQFNQDSQLYGVAIFRTMWDVVKKRRTRVRKVEQKGFDGTVTGSEYIRDRELATTYEGNTIECQDPFLFFPDPMVPMCEVNKRGEFVFWRTFQGLHWLKKMEADGSFMWVDEVARGTYSTNNQSLTERSRRDLLSGGEASGSLMRMTEGKGTAYHQIDEGTCEIIPAELGLGDSTDPEKWLFTWANKNRILRAEPFEADHDMHPVAVAEPYSLGYGFGQPGMADYLGPLQDTMSWLVNSHIQNIRGFLNNMLVVDPSMIEMQDLKNPEPGKLIRLKRAAYGQDVRTAVHQLQQVDVTSGHIKDMSVIMSLGERITAATDNRMGLQDSGGRKTATEVRTSAEAGASRLASQARIISAQAMVDVSEIMVLNTQQYISDDFYMQVVGVKGENEPVNITPEMLVGDFHYPVHDGTLPLDKVALLDVWKEIFVAVSQDPLLRQEFSISKIFEFVAELGGAKNIGTMKVQMNMQSPEAIAAGAQAGNLVPLPRPKMPRAS